MKTSPLCLSLAALVSLAHGQGFGPETSFPGTASGSHPADFIPVDFNGDGDIDLLQADLGDDTLRLTRNLGDGQFGNPFALLSGLADPTGAAMLDVDLDGDLDLLLGTGSFSSGSAYVWYYERLETGFAPYEFLSAFALANSGATVEIYDMEGDGDLDVSVIGHPSAGQNRFAYWLRFDGPSVFTETPSQYLNLAGRVFRVDLDGDGILDTAGTRRYFGDHQVVWFKGQQNGTYVEQGVISAVALNELRSMDVADMDGDGDLDILTLHHPSRDVRVIENLGGGNFAAPQTIVTGPATSLQDGTVLGADVDQDGDTDPVVFGDSGAFWLENLGGGRYGAQTFFPNQVNPAYAWALDLDGDLDLDLVGTNFGGATFQLNDLRFGNGYCFDGVPNSTGEVGQISASGSSEALLNDVTLLGLSLPPSAFGYFLVSDATGSVANPGGSQGILCLGGQVGRFNRAGEVFQTSSAGTASLDLDLTNVPTPTGATVLMAGDTRYFQAWHRDANPMATSNFSNGLRVQLR